MNVTTDTLETVKSVFMNLFCTPKNSLENPLFRASGHGGSTSRTFIVEDYSEDEYGQWATDEVTDEQGYIDDAKVVLLDMGRQRVYLAVQTVKKSPSEEKKRKGKAKGKVVSKELEECSLVKNKHRILNCGQKKIIRGGPKKKRGKKGFFER